MLTLWLQEEAKAFVHSIHTDMLAGYSVSHIQIIPEGCKDWPKGKGRENDRFGRSIPLTEHHVWELPLTFATQNREIPKISQLLVLTVLACIPLTGIKPSQRCDIYVCNVAIETAPDGSLQSSTCYMIEGFIPYVCNHRSFTEFLNKHFRQLGL